MSSDLKPCPFCGGRPEKRLGVNEWWVSCQSCEASSGMWSDYDSVIAAWNTRAAPPPPSELREQIARIVDPGSWAVMDGYLTEAKRQFRNVDAAYDPDAFKHKRSLAVADQIIALLTGERPEA